MSDQIFVSSSMFTKMQADSRVTPDLAHCVYCTVITRNQEDSISRATGYKIPLDCVNGKWVKQCPSCKTIYILGDPINAKSE